MFPPTMDMTAASSGGGGKCPDFFVGLLAVDEGNVGQRGRHRKVPLMLSWVAATAEQAWHSFSNCLVLTTRGDATWGNRDNICKVASPLS